MAANHHLRRLTSVSSPALSRLSKPPASPLLRPTFSSSAFLADQSAAAAGAAAAEKGEARSAMKEADEPQSGDASARKVGEEEDDGGLDLLLCPGLPHRCVLLLAAARRGRASAFDVVGLLVAILLTAHHCLVRLPARCRGGDGDLALRLLTAVAETHHRMAGASSTLSSARTLPR
ncbi:uncharacterized protein [Triticum aestivum]|uniref:uncharacterized protein n=1 Tax=Triticum aestivum TaxID=4565 RepID=UPI001D0096B1|nr:uncharacterized protein LOC123038974 [Triticum aestivum]